MPRTPSVVPPHAPHAEAAVLGLCLLSREACELLANHLTPQDFYSPSNAHIADAILHLHRRGAHVDTISVATRLGEGNLLEAIGGPARVLSLLADAPSRASMLTHIGTVRDRAVRRRFISAAAELMLKADDPNVPLDHLDMEARAMPEFCGAGLTGEAAALTAEDFLAQTAPEQILVPGFLGARDRVCLLARPGYGKSTLERQLAVQLSAGIHPFKPRVHYPPLNVLYLDIENPAYLVREHLSRLVTKVDNRKRQRGFQDVGDDWDPNRLMVCVREEGLDVLSPAGARWFRTQVRATNPDVLIYGPIYKLARGRPTDEDFAVAVTDFLNDLRTTYDTAIIVETHPPHPVDGGRTPIDRPYGASAWERWPDLGYVLRQRPDDDGVVREWELTEWRPSRVERPDWSRILMRGREGDWPWITAYGKERF